MGLLAKILHRRLIQTSTATFHDGWSRIPISFHLYEDRWGRRSYRVQAPAGVIGAGQHRFFEDSIVAWMQGGDLPPLALGEGRTGGSRARRDAYLVQDDEPERLNRADRERILKLLNMLGSEHDGEILNAAKAVTALLRARNTSWTAVVRLDPDRPS